MVTFLDLPEETICLVAEELDRQRDRYSLVLSCRRLYTVLLPTLYSQVTLCDVRNHTIGQVSRFLNAIARQPQLANAVRSLRLETWETEDDNEDIDCEFEYDAELVDRLVADTRCFTKPRDQLMRGNTDAWLALLIPQLKGLRQISICYPYGSEYVNEMFVEAAKEDTTPFPRLTDAFAEWYDTENGIHASCMDPFFKFPAVRRIGGSSMVDSDREEEAPRITPFSGVTDIDLEMTNTECGFGVWMESCKALKTFRLNVGGAIISEGPDLVSTRLRESLSLHKTSLEAFWLCGESYEPLDDDDGWMGSFADFNMMKYLHISISMIAGLDDNLESTKDLAALLPPSLETLYLCHCPEELLEWSLDQMERLIDSNSLPRLTSLGLEGYGLSEAHESSLQTMCKLAELDKKCTEAEWSRTILHHFGLVPNLMIVEWNWLAEEQITSVFLSKVVLYSTSHNWRHHLTLQLFLEP
ncbi:unnamed protein product [Penicillium glandicola]